MNSGLAEHVSTDGSAKQKARLQAFRASHPRVQTTLAGTTWSYLLRGQGAETVLLLPGGERIGDFGFSLMQQFEQQYRCLYPNYPPVPTMNALVEGVVALLDQLVIERVIVFAASFGGDVGQCFVRKYPQRVSKLILLNTGIPNQRLGRATRRAKPLVTRLPLRMVRFLTRKLLMKALSVRGGEFRFWQAFMDELVATLTRADMISSVENTIDYRLNYTFVRDDLRAWNGKMLILQSDDDPATTPAMREALCYLYPQAQHYMFHQAGHTPFLSQPDEFYAYLWTFLREGGIDVTHEISHH